MRGVRNHIIFLYVLLGMTMIIFYQRSSSIEKIEVRDGIADQRFTDEILRNRNHINSVEAKLESALITGTANASSIIHLREELHEATRRINKLEKRHDRLDALGVVLRLPASWKKESDK